MRRLVVVLSLPALLAALCTAVSGVEIKQGNSVFYPKGEPVQGDILAAGSSVSIQSEVKGDVTAAGQAVSVTGPVKDSVLLAGNNVQAGGSIGNDAWMAGNTVALDGSVKDNAYMAGSTVRLSDKARVGSDLLAAGAQIELMGAVGGNARLAGASIVIGGTIDGNVYAQGQKIHVLKGAVIKGDFICRSPMKPVVDEGASILGETKYAPLPKAKVAKPRFWPAFAGWFGSFVAAVIFGAVTIALFPAASRTAANTLRGSFWVSLGVGVVAMIVTPIACVIAMITLIGIPLALAALSIYFILLYAAWILAGLAIGQWIIGRRRQTLPRPIGSMILGVFILAVIWQIPFVGWIVDFLALIAGLGALTTGWWRSRAGQAAG